MTFLSAATSELELLDVILAGNKGVDFDLVVTAADDEFTAVAARLLPRPNF